MDNMNEITASKESLDYMKQLQKEIYMKIDLSNFEKELNDFKEKFYENYRH